MILPQTMRALVVRQYGGPLEMEERPLPAPKAGEALVRVRACAVDHFDVAIRNGRRPDMRPPLVLGHEIAGEVAALGEAVADPPVGARVASTLYVTCGRCRFCRSGRETICLNFGGYIGGQWEGGYAEYVRLPADMVLPIPDDLPFPQASILANAIGTPYHALLVRGRLRPGERAVVVGAGGGVGLHAVQLARMAGAWVAGVDRGSAKLEAIREAGADLALEPEGFGQAVKEATGGWGADLVLELVGAATYPQSLAALARAGRLVVVGAQGPGELTIDPQRLIREEIEILGSRNVTKEELRQVIDLVRLGRVRPVISLVRPLAAAEELHQLLKEGGIVGRAVLEP